MRRAIVTLAVVLAGCGGGDRQETPAAGAASSDLVPRGPDHLVLRVPRAGGQARVYSYPGLDSVVWSTSTTPAPTSILAFDEEAGTIAYVTSKGAPALIDFRQGTAATVTKTKLTGLASWDGSNIFGITVEGGVERHGPSGPWKWRGKFPVRAVFPQPNASLLVLAMRGDSSVVWRLRPPVARIVDSVALTRVNRTLRTQVGDRLYLGSARELTGVRTRTMQRTASIEFDGDIEVLEATPSGDRVFVVLKDGLSVEVVDRFREVIRGQIEIGRHASDLRVDPLGRYLLARPEGTDSILVIAVGTNRVMGAVATTWREDLPFVAPDGGIALAQGDDVVIVDGETLKQRAVVRGGAADFWYGFRWTGFRPRDARLDRPVKFDDGRPDTAATPDSVSPAADSASPPAQPVPPRDTVRRPSVWTVSFAALLTADKARELAGQIRVGTENARVVTAARDGSTVYRVVMGPYPTREEAERIGRDSRQSFWVYEGGP